MVPNVDTTSGCFSFALNLRRLASRLRLRGHVVLRLLSKVRSLHRCRSSPPSIGRNLAGVLRIFPGEGGTNVPPNKKPPKANTLQTQSSCLRPQSSALENEVTPLPEIMVPSSPPHFVGLRSASHILQICMGPSKHRHGWRIL